MRAGGPAQTTRCRAAPELTPLATASGELSPFTLDTRTSTERFFPASNSIGPILIYVLNRSAIAGVLIPALALVAASLQGALAEKSPQAGQKGPLTVVAPTDTAMPDAYKLNILIRTTLIALSQANQTGNYSVLRDLGTPQFQAMNSDARLGEIFAGLRQRNLDFSPIIFFDPKLIRPAAIQPGGMLRLTGYIDTRPERVLFDMGFELVQTQWRLSAIVVDMNVPAAEQKPAAAAKDSVPKPVSKAKSKP